MIRDEQKQFGIVFIILLLSRIPFLFYGYGSEEDAWAIPLVAERIGTTGIYEVFRLPGHPFQELFYSLIWNCSSVIYNLCTALLSSVGIIFFMAALKKLHIRNWLFAGAGLAFTPVIYINSCNDMDYTWALAFMLIAFYCVIQRHGILAGLFIALAVGCRITSGAILIPFAYLLWNCSLPEKRIKSLLQITVSTLIASLIIYIPVIRLYGFSFFTYYEHFPIPAFAKNFYKGTLAVWGLPGCLVLFSFVYFILTRRRIISPAFLEGKDISKVLLITCSISVILFTVSFMKVPLKSAFMIPVIPFVWVIAALLIEVRIYRPLVIIVILSCFIFGINLSDPLRGSKESNYTLHTVISGQTIAFDPLSGPFVADITKREQRTTFANSVLKNASAIHEKTFIIAGWWLADLLVLQRGKENKEILFRYYTDEPELKWYKEKGYKIYYLPEQEMYNDLRFKKTFTLKYASAFPM